LVLTWRFRFKVHSNASMSNMIYVKKPIELIIFMSVGGTVSTNRNVSYVSPTRVCARVNYIDVNTTRKNGQTDDRIAVGDPWSLVFDWLKRISSIKKTVLNMHLGVHWWFPSRLSLCLTSLFETGTIVLLESVVSESVITITSISRSRSRARTLLYYRSLRMW
jgi:hypothetical protein